MDMCPQGPNRKITGNNFNSKPYSLILCIAMKARFSLKLPIQILKNINHLYSDISNNNILEVIIIGFIERWADVKIIRSMVFE